MSRVEHLVREALHDPARALEPPADPMPAIRARARRETRHRRTAMAAALAAVALAVAVPVGVQRLGDRSAPVAPATPPVRPASPPAGQGLLEWEPRGPLAVDATFVREATEVWRRTPAAHPPEGPVYVVWAGRVGAGRLAVLQARDRAGRAWVATVADRDDPPTLRVLAATLGGTTEVLPVTYDGNTGLPQLSPGPGARIVQFLLAPALTRQALDVRVGRSGNRLDVSDDGMSGPTLVLDAPVGLTVDLVQGGSRSFGYLPVTGSVTRASTAH